LKELASTSFEVGIVNLITSCDAMDLMHEVVKKFSHIVHPRMCVYTAAPVLQIRPGTD